MNEHAQSTPQEADRLYHIEELRKYAEWLEDAYMGELARQGALAMTPNDMRAALREDHGVSEVWPGDAE